MTNVITDAGFVDGRAGRLFRVRSWPAVRPDASPSVTVPSVLIIPPFAEEMNRSRRFLAALRRAIASRGAHAEILDHHGTGDSEGDLVETSWALWRDDLVAAVERLRASGAAHVTLLGVRAGCLLVDEVARFLGEPADRLVHVQPETNGEAVLHRLLRARAAMSRLSGKPSESVDELWSRLERGESLQLGGYRVGAALAMALREQRTSPDASPRSREVSYRVRFVEPASRHTGTDDVSEEVSRTPWSECILVSRPFWQLQDSVPDAATVARLSSLIASGTTGHRT